MSEKPISRRTVLLGAAALAAFPGTANAQSQEPHTIDTYRFNPEGDVTAHIGHVRDWPLDVGLLHPEDGAPTAGFYAALDTHHGKPFSLGWRNIYRKFLRDNPIHTTDQGTMIMVARHVQIHAVTVEQMSQAYHVAKEAWDRNPSLRLLSHDAHRQSAGPSFR